MPPLENGRHELFAQELAAGKTADEAYEAAGYKPNRGNAARLKANDGVRARVAELQAQAAELVVQRVELSIAGLTRQLEGIMTLALAGSSAAHLSAARQAVMDIAKLNGLVVERQANANTTLEGLLGSLDAGDDAGDAGEPEEA